MVSCELQAQAAGWGLGGYAASLLLLYLYRFAPFSAWFEPFELGMLGAQVGADDVLDYNVCRRIAWALL